MWWCAHRQPDLAGAVVGQLDGDVGGRIACADNENVAALIGPSVAKVAGMHQLAAEMIEARPGQAGTAGVWYLPVASTTADVRISPAEVSTSQSPAARSMRLTSHPSASVMF